MTIAYDHIRATVPETQREAGMTPVRISLLPNAVMSLAGEGQGFALTCHAGRLWVTQPGDPADHLLAAGERFVAEGKGSLVLQALNEAVVSVTPQKA